MTFKKIIKYAQCYENFRNSTSFQPELMRKTTGPTSPTKVTPDIERCIQFSMPFYLEMYEQRMKVSNSN
jgi:hypothetical protein